MNTFVQPLFTSINQVCVVGGTVVDGGEFGVTILAQKCEWGSGWMVGDYFGPKM